RRSADLSQHALARDRRQQHPQCAVHGGRRRARHRPAGRRLQRAATVPDHGDPQCLRRSLHLYAATGIHQPLLQVAGAQTGRRTVTHNEKTPRSRTRLAMVGTLATALTMSASASPVIDVLQDGPFGLHAASGLKLTTGACADCATIPQALWYFQNEVIAAPEKGVATAGHTA